MSDYDLILADPAWPETGGGGRGTGNHYETIPYPDIPRVVLSAPCFKPAPAFWLGVWTTVSSMPEGLRLLDAAGCRYITMWTWIKTKPSNQDELFHGMGQYGRHGCEFIVWGKRGTIGRADGAKKALASFPAEAFPAPVGAHSVKPQFAYDQAKRTFKHHKRLAMFERSDRNGWDLHGDEAPDVR